MLNVEELRTGQVSLPVIDADDLPYCCFSCNYLFGKEFSDQRAKVLPIFAADIFSLKEILSIHLKVHD